MRPELTIAEKEFMDHLTSKRFLAILAVLMLLAAYAVVMGMNSYNQSLDNYKAEKATGTSRYQEAIQGQQNAIDAAIKSNASADQIHYMENNLDDIKNSRDSYLNPDMPSILQVFQAFTVLFAILGMVLGIALGFDQLTKEKESGSLKSVLSAPIYRDSLINGKAIGSLAALGAAMGVVFLVTIAIMLFYGVVPGLDDLVRICAFFVASMLYCTAFFAIATLTSTISKNSAMAIIFAVGIVVVVVVFSLMSAIISSSIAGMIVGPAPAYQAPVSYEENVTLPEADVMPAPVAVYGVNTSDNSFNDYYNREYRIQSQVADILNIVSPVYDFTGMGSINGGIATLLLTKNKPVDYTAIGTYTYQNSQQISLLGSLSYVWGKILALIVETVCAFAISYVLFMRMDIR